MPLQREVTLTIDLEGNVVIEVKGVKGPSCKDLTSQVEKALGKTTSTQKTGEYTQTQTTQTVNQNRGS